MSDDDIVARLREYGMNAPTGFRVYHKAADEITRLRVDLAAEREKNCAPSAFEIGVMAERDAARADLAAARANAEDWQKHFRAVIEQRHKAEADLAAANALLSKWDALINYQFSGSREAMSAMTECAQETAQHLYGPPPWPSRIDAALKGDDHE